MDEFTDSEIAKLLRLKRFEQPRPGYFENFLHEFHRRQRDELLRQPLWRICWERTHDFIFRLNIPSLTAYPAAAAILVLAAIISLKVYQHPQPANVALDGRPAISTVSTNVDTESEWTLSSPVATRVLSTRSLHKFNHSAQTHRAATPPRYVLDSVPVSYETTFRF